MAAHILQETAIGKNYASDKVSKVLITSFMWGVIDNACVLHQHHCGQGFCNDNVTIFKENVQDNC